MSNGDYREKIEEHRQSIELEEQSSRMSRSRQTGKKKKKNKNRKNPLINILLFILLGIPASLLIYVSFFYNPGATETAAVEHNGSLVEVQTNNTVSSSGKQKEEPKIEEDSEKENTEGKNEDAKKAEAEAELAKAELAKAELAKAEKAKLEEQEKLAKQKEQQQKEQQQKEEQQKEEQQKEQQASKTHTVQPNENLFRIALKYYNDASGVDKIMQANNLSSNSISVGQTLIIP